MPDSIDRTRDAQPDPPTAASGAPAAPQGPLPPTAASPGSPFPVPAPPASTPPASVPPASAPPQPGQPQPVLRVDPNRTSDPAWREPAWFPPRNDANPTDGADRTVRRDPRSGMVAVVVGLLLIAVGAWSFLANTLGIDLARIPGGDLSAVTLLVLGAFVLVRSVQRRS